MRPLPSFREYLRQVYAALRDTSPKKSSPCQPSRPPVFSGDYPSWQAASLECGSYDAGEIFKKTKAAALAVRDGRAAFERDSVLFDKPEHRWEVLSAMFWQAAKDQGRLSVLDFGGSLGSVYYQSRAFLDDLPLVKWGVVEQPHYVDFGNKELSTSALSFFFNMDACISAIKPNVALFGGVLQYLPSPYTVLEKVLSHQIPSVVFDKFALLDQPVDRITVQRVPPEIYDASYPAWFFSESRFTKFIESAGYTFRAEWRNIDDYPLEGAETAINGYHSVRRS